MAVSGEEIAQGVASSVAASVNISPDVSDNLPPSDDAPMLDDDCCRFECSY